MMRPSRVRRWQHGQQWSKRWPASTGERVTSLWSQSHTLKEATEGRNTYSWGIRWVVSMDTEGWMWMSENMPKNSTDKDKRWWEAGRMKQEHKNKTKNKTPPNTNKPQQDKVVKKEATRPGSSKHLHCLKPKQEIRRKASAGGQLRQKHKDIQVFASYSSDWGMQKVPRCTAGI